MGLSWAREVIGDGVNSDCAPNTRSEFGEHPESYVWSGAAAKEHWGVGIGAIGHQALDVGMNDTVRRGCWHSEYADSPIGNYLE